MKYSNGGLHKAGIACILLGASIAASATTLLSGNSLANLIDDGANTGTLNTWSIAGMNQVFQETYFFRVGRSGAMQNISALTLTGIDNPTADSATYNFSGAGFQLSVRYLLTGDTTISDLAEVVRVRNTSDGPLDFTLIEYDDFDLNGTAGGDTAGLLNSSTIRQFQGQSSIVIGGTPIPNHYEIAPFANLLVEMASSNFVNLNDNGSTQSGDMTFAFQWDMNIAGGDSKLISKDKLLTVPEPATVAVLALGAIGMLRRRKR